VYWVENEKLNCWREYISGEERILEQLFIKKMLHMVDGILLRFQISSIK
jgi:hypothetical protein